MENWQDKTKATHLKEQALVAFFIFLKTYPKNLNF